MSTPQATVQQYLTALDIKSTADTQATLVTERKKFADTAIAEVRKAITYGAANELQETLSDLASKKCFNMLLGNSQLPIYQLRIIKSPLSKVDKKKIIDETIAQLKKFEVLGFSAEDHKYLKAKIARFLMGALFPEVYGNNNDESASVLPQKEYSDFLYANRITRLFKTGNCGDQVKLALDFLVKNYGSHQALYPISIIQIATKSNASHVYLQMGENGGSDTLCCDPWLQKSYLEKDLIANTKDFWIKMKQKGGTAVDIMSAFTIKSKEEVEFILANLDPKITEADLGVTAAEVENWVNAFYDCFTSNKKENSEGSFYIGPEGHVFLCRSNTYTSAEETAVLFQSLARNVLTATSGTSGSAAAPTANPVAAPTASPIATQTPQPVIYSLEIANKKVKESTDSEARQGLLPTTKRCLNCNIM